ncbi:MAG: type II 3-dehydroquinate dehydratase [Deltaproteobacteria bacterium]|nr:type II 3-dehydroquinate dehydratase [Deltaproteobacteria bacterium]
MSPDHARILVANGVNLDLLGRREPDIYGKQTLGDIETALTQLARGLEATGCFRSCRLSFYQSNSEEQFLLKLSEPWDGILLNPGAWTHTSLALGDRMKALGTPYIELHLSALCRREAIRQRSYTAEAALGVIQGLGPDSYTAGLTALLSYLSRFSREQAHGIDQGKKKQEASERTCL